MTTASPYPPPPSCGVPHTPKCVTLSPAPVHPAVVHIASTVPTPPKPPSTGLAGTGVENLPGYLLLIIAFLIIGLLILGTERLVHHIQKKGMH